MKKILLLLIVSLALIQGVSAITWDGYQNKNNKIFVYTFNQGSGTTIIDILNSLNNGTYDSTPLLELSNWTGFNNASRHSASRLLTSLTINDSLQYNFTIEMRLNPADVTSDGFLMMGDSTNGWGLSFDGGNQLSWVIGGCGQTNSNGVVLTTHKNVYLVVTRSDSTWRLYENGVNLVNRTCTASTFNGRTLYFGRDPSAGFGGFYNGQVDQMILWDRALSSLDILNANSSDGEGNFTTNLLNLTVTLTNPSDNGALSTLQSYFNASLLPFNGNLTNATLQIWYSNGSLYNQTITSVTGQGLNTSSWLINFSLLGQYRWNVYGCARNNTAGFCTNAPTNLTFFIGARLNSNLFNASTYETFIESFTTNVSLLSSTLTLSGATFYWNGTNYGGSVISLGSNNYLLTKTITIPSVIGNTSWFWSLNYSNGVTQNLTSNFQLVQSLPSISVLTNCTTVGLTPAFFFSGFTEINLTALPINVQYNFQYGLSGNSTGKLTFGNLTATNGFYICINATTPTYSVGYGEIQYEANNFVPRRYYIFNTTRLTNITTNVTLHELDTGLSTSFKITAQDVNLNVFVDYYIGLLRWYPNLNSYRTVEMAKTDDKGQTVLHVKTEDVDYRFALYSRDGTLIELFNSVRMVCTSAPCSYPLIITSTSNQYNVIGNIQMNLSYNNNTNTFTFIWNDPSQTTSSMNLTVFKDRGVDSIVVCSSQSLGYTGVITCSAGSETGLLRAEVYRSASPQEAILSMYQDVRDYLSTRASGDIGLFLTFIIAGFLAGIGSFISPVIGIILAIIGLVPALAFGSIKLGFFIAFAVLGGLVIRVMLKK